MKETKRMATVLAQSMIRSGLRLSVAESCTGGLAAAVLTDMPGSSDWFECALVTYSNASKQALLGVPADLIERDGAVSESVVRAMAEGALSRSSTDISLAISGIAGPGGGTEDKPVGTVWIAWAGGDVTRARLWRFSGDRAAIREQAVAAALRGAVGQVAGVSGDEPEV